jgi:hypothetical protein
MKRINKNNLPLCPNYVKLPKLASILLNFVSYAKVISFCPTFAKVIDLWQFFNVFPSYAKLFTFYHFYQSIMFSQLMPNSSNYIKLCQTYQIFAPLMPKFSAYVKLCQFIKFCPSYANIFNFSSIFLNLCQNYKISSSYAKLI